MLAIVSDRTNKSRVKELEVSGMVRMGPSEVVTFEQRFEGGKGGSHVEVGHARCI